MGCGQSSVTETRIKSPDRQVLKHDLNYNQEEPRTMDSIPLGQESQPAGHEQGSKVGRLNEYSDKEYTEDIFKDAKGIENDLKQDVEITMYQIQYLELLARFFQLYEKCCGNIPRYPSIPSGDPNTTNFPLPDSAGLFRVDLHDDTSTFDHHIDGDAAWEVIPQDIVKEDLTTPEQDSVHEKREKRTDLNDRERMKKRRLELASYFIKERADGLTTYCEKYLGFADTLEEGWAKFQELL